MVRSISTVLVTGAIACAAGSAWAQSSPIPDTRVPGFGGSDITPGLDGRQPGAAAAAAIGSNVGAGATASPIGNDPKPLAETAEVPPDPSR